MNRIFSFVLCIIIFSLSFTSCASESENEMLKNAKLNDTESSMNRSYDEFSGQRLNTVALEADTVIKVEIVTNTGELDLSIVDKSGNEAYKGNSLKTGSFSVIVDRDSDYTIKLIAKSHEGSYKIEWD